MNEKINAFESVLDLIGNTPLIKLNKVTENLDGNFYAKVEAFNPGHSSKDRIALYIIEEAEKLVNSDPAVQAKIFEADLTVWYGSATLELLKEMHNKIAKNKI